MIRLVRLAGCRIVGHEWIEVGRYDWRDDGIPAQPDPLNDGAERWPGPRVGKIYESCGRCGMRRWRYMYAPNAGPYTNAEAWERWLAGIGPVPEQGDGR